ncbi:MAG: hypothetical protein H7246_06740, partial [Phycisphaerae bacterium]|nr:hypothetical protein [Saprospiraceae bacterium]
MKSLYPDLVVLRTAVAMRSRLFFLFFFLITASRLAALDYYWVNGNGDWSDFANHWAKIPVPLVPGDYHANIPTSGDDVYFGANGGTAYTVNVNAGSTVPKCRNMDWTAVPAGTVMGGGGGNLDIYGSITLDANMSMTFSGQVHIIAEGGTSMIFSDGVYFSTAVYFEGSGGGWQFMDDFFCNSDIQHTGGLIETMNHDITVGSTFYGHDGILHLGTSTLKMVNGWAYLWYPPAQFEGANSKIELYSGNGVQGAWYRPTAITIGSLEAFNTSYIAGLQYVNSAGTVRFHGPAAMVSNFTIPQTPLHHNVIFEKGARIDNANNFDALTFTAGQTYTIGQVSADYPNMKQTIVSGGTFTAMGAGTCSEFITIRSWQYGTAVRFVNDSGNDITVGCVILEDVHAEGDNALINNDGVDLGNNTGWIFVDPHGAMDLYWVGGAGDWDDPCHWTTDPLGTVGDCNCTPNAATNVFFTANSGFSPNPSDVEYINTLADASYLACNDMDWTAVTGKPTFHSVYNGAFTSDQLIYGSLKYSPDMVQDFLGTTRFRTIGTCTLLSAGQIFKDLLFFEGTGELSFLDAFSYSNGAPYYNDVYHLRGTIKTLGNSIDLGVNNGWQGNKDLNNNFVDHGAKLWLGEIGGSSSTVTISGNVTFVAAYEAGKFHPVKSHIKSEGPGGVTVTADNRPHDFWDVSFVNNFSGTFYGGILNKLTYDGTYGIVANSSPNRLIHEMEMKDDGEINGNQTFDIVTLTGGNGYTLQNGSVQTITSGGAFNTTSDCEKYVTLTSGLPDKTSEIRKEGGGALTINYVVLDNITADLSTGATYSAVNGVGIGTTTGWSVINSPARLLYWVGGDGDWNSSAHWSLSSGGGGGECPPTPLDNVFFDGASGLNATNMVTISQRYAHCKDMDWTGVGNGTKLIGGNINLYLFGNLTLSAGMNYEIGATYFRASQPATITSAGNKYYTTYFWSPTGEWTLMDDFETIKDVDVYHYYGTLRSNNHTIGVGRIWWGAAPYYTVPGYISSPTAKLFLGSSKMRFYPTPVWAAEGAFSYQFGNFDAGTSEIIFESGVYLQLFAPAWLTEFYDVTFKGPRAYFGNGRVNNKLRFEKEGSFSSENNGTDYFIYDLEFLDDGAIYGGRDIHKIKFAPGKRYTFQGTTNIIPYNGLEGQFIAQGLPGQYIEIKSDNFN